MLNILSHFIGFLASFPARIFRSKISAPKYVTHSEWPNYLSEHFNRPNVRVLEVGSRVVTGANFRKHFDKAHYIGFDFYEGKNVDVVGDAHKLSTYFKSDEPFDLIFCSAVFEHLHMPWVVAEEMTKILKIGGCVFVETHFSYSSHERPWHFFQFSEMALRSLFSNAMGYELVDSGLSNPIWGFFTHSSVEKLRYKAVRELYCHSAILVKKVRENRNFEWGTCNLDEIVEGTRYPLNR